VKGEFETRKRRVKKLFLYQSKIDISIFFPGTNESTKDQF
jgi:hypothetical protein